MHNKSYTHLAEKQGVFDSYGLLMEILAVHDIIVETIFVGNNSIFNKKTNRG